MSEPAPPDADTDEPHPDGSVLAPTGGTVERRPLVPLTAEEVRTVSGEVVSVRDAWGRFGAPRPEPPDPANRPIILERPLRRFNAFYGLPPARARTGLVIVTPRNGPRPVGPTGRPSRAEVFRTGGTLYEVDLGLHHTAIELELPSRDDLISFRATAEIEWRVVDHARVVGDNIRDVREALGPALRRRLRSVTRQFETTALSAADEAANLAIADWDPGRRYGLETSVVLRLAGDDPSAEHAAARLALRQKLEIEELDHQLKDLIDRHDQQRQRARLAVYRDIISKGNIEQFALQLASHPDDVSTIMQLARDERHEERRQLTDFLTHLLSSGAIDRWDVEDQVREALVWLAESTQHAVQSGEFGRRWSPPTRGINGHG